MAQTTTDVNACDVAIWIDDSAGTPRDVSGSTNECSLTFTHVTGETRTFGSRWPRRKGCMKDCKIALNIVYSEAENEMMDVWKHWFFTNPVGARTVTIYVPDKNVGSDKYQGEFIIDGDTNIPLQAGSAEPIVVTTQLSITGEGTWVTNAT